MKACQIILLLFISNIISSCSEKPQGWIDKERLLKREDRDWLSLGGNHLQQHYSPLNQINITNIDDLGFAWEFDASSPIGRVPRGLEATPIVVDGIMYTSGAWGFVYAIDAQTGNEIWRFSPEVDASYARRACCDVVNRGVAVWEGKVYVGSLDGILYCLNSETGEVIWRKDTFTDRTKAYTITSPPQVAGKVVVIGNSGGEYGVRGYITAYDLETGDQRWRFFLVPGDPDKGFEHPEMEMASKTWDPDSHWESGGGGTSWGEAAYDPELNLLYVGTGNSSPYPIWFRSPAGGDNLFLVSILAINPDNGQLAWHYQTTPGELWDYTATMNIVLAELEINGELRKVLMQAPKNGFFYVLDRATGELLSAEKYTRVNWASHIDMETGRPVLTEQGQWYKDGPKLVYPSLSGGHSWQPMSFNPNTGLVYIPEHNWAMVYAAVENYEWEPDKNNTGIDYSVMGNYSLVTDQIKEAQDTIYSESLLAWDPITQKKAWKVSDGAPDGGTLSTPQLVFQGTRTGYLKVYDARTGQKLKEIFTGTGIMAAPTTYSINGEQYVAVMAGQGGAPVPYYPPDAVLWQYKNYGRILAFKLDGVEVPLPEKTQKVETPPPPEFQVDLSLAEAGEPLYWEYCAACHGGLGEYHFSQHPDLAKMNKGTHDLFSKIVLEGLFSNNGMASFSNSLSEKEVESIHQFLIREQQKLYTQNNK